LPGKNGKSNGKPDNLATVMTDVSERVTVLVKEELELAKAEVQQKVKSLGKGLIAGGIGVVFALLLIPFALLALAWGLNSALGSIWLGFVIVAGVLLVLMGGAFLFAWRKFKVGAPVPKTAIEEAKKIRETVSAKGHGNGNGAIPAAAIPAPVALAPAPIGPAPVAPAPVAPAPAAVAVAPAPATVAIDVPTTPTPVAPAATTAVENVAADTTATAAAADTTQADTTEVDAVSDDASDGD